MRRIISAIALAFILLLALTMLVSGPSAAQEPDPPPAKGSGLLPSPPTTGSAQPIDPALLPKIEPQLLRKLLAEDAPVSFIVVMQATTDLNAAVAAVPAMGAQGAPDPVKKRTAVVNALQQTARQSQGGVLQQLSNPAGGLSSQAATHIHPLWIVNAVAATGNLPMVLDLAARPDVAIVRLDKTIQLNRPRPYANSLVPRPQTGFEWGISKIRANLVQSALHINGSGVVVANIDSGVDWQHPALQGKYRGYTGPGHLPQHAGNWYDATGQGATYPVDAYGHGTHTMGTMVGDGGIGVAPGARWIAVRAFDSGGSAQDSWLHAAFQWVLAPNNNPALAPAIVNNSWGSSNGYSTEFQADVQALLAAGIFPVFSAGNNGPSSGSIGSPGSLGIALAVGATTIDDEIANFSSRGPSPWGVVKPGVSAPGKDVLSTLPGGTYGRYNGTSMAAPHVSGLAALLLQASPALSNNLTEIQNTMQATAVQLGSPIPNNMFGWGRVDAYNAVMAVASVGALRGTVTGSGSPLAGATVQIVPRSGGGAVVNAATSGTGIYHQGLASTRYDVTASAFGYEAATIFNLNIVTNSTVTQDFNLTPKPTGTFSGTVKENGTNLPLAATIYIDNTPATATTNPVNGRFNLTLPTGTYTATVVAAAHRITQAVNIVINDGATVVRHFLLDPAPTILLVDSGRWYQESQIVYYQQALDDLFYPYNVWTIANTATDVPTTSILSNYDIVIWSSPFDSPGYIGAATALEKYLDGGGKLLLSGQDVAYFDSGSDIFVPAARYFTGHLKARFVGETTGQNPVSGMGGEPFAGLSLSLSGGDGANNQTHPDIIANAGPDFAGPLLAYEPGDGDDLAGLHIGLCVPYRALYLSFGFESINSRAHRRQVMERAIDWLEQSPAARGVTLSPAAGTAIGNFGSTVSHTIRLRNTGTQNDTYSLTLDNGSPYNWPISPGALSPVLLNSCQAQTFTLNVQVAIANTWHVSDTFTVTAVSAAEPARTAVATRTTKTPAPVLLVDDDRWYSFAQEYKDALAANNMAYDYWQVPKSWSGPVPPSPRLNVLQMYPMVVWYTAYDWYQPLVTAEEDRLAAYLNGGGRLFFSSQDYIYNLPEGKPSPFAQTYLGVLDHTEDYSTTTTTGWPGSLVGHGLGPYPLNFPFGYNNWTDALTATATAQAATRGQEGQINSVTHAGVGPGGNWHTNFLAYGPEVLTATHRARLLQRSLGWLSWLGRSTTTPSVSASLDGNTVTYTATVVNDGWSNLPRAYFTATFPSELSLNSYSTGLSPAGGNLVWNGPLARNESQVFTYTAAIAGSLPLGTLVRQVSWLSYPEHNILFDRVADVLVNFPNLDSSTMRVNPAQGVEPSDVLTYTVVLKNTGLVDAPNVTTTDTLPHMLDLVAVDSPGKGSVLSYGNSFTWTTPLSRNEVVTLTYRAVISYQSQNNIHNVAVVDDGFNSPLFLAAPASFKTLPTYLPLITKN